MTLLLDGVRQALGLLASGDGEIWSIRWLSLEVSGSATLISLLIGIPAGTALALTRFPGRGLVVSVVNSGMGLPPVVVGLFGTIVLWRGGPLGSRGSSASSSWRSAPRASRWSGRCSARRGYRCWPPSWRGSVASSPRSAPR